MAHIFLSYGRIDEPQVQDIYDRLKTEGFDPWMDRQDILPGEQWALNIQDAQRTADFFLACLSSRTVDKRGYLQREQRTALDLSQEFLDEDIYVIPVRLDKCEIPRNLQKFNGLTCLRLTAGNDSSPRYVGFVRGACNFSP